MEKGEKAQPYIKRQECKQTNKLADEAKQVINPLINFSLSPAHSLSVCKPLRSCHRPHSKAGPIWSRVCFCLSVPSSPSSAFVLRVCRGLLRTRHRFRLLLNMHLPQNQPLISTEAWDPHICKSTSVPLQRGDSPGSRRTQESHPHPKTNRIRTHTDTNAINLGVSDRWPPKTNPRHMHIRFQTLFHSPPSQTSHPQHAELIKIRSCQSVSLCQHSVFFCQEAERQEAEICSLAQGRLLWREARGPEGTYSILHKWHHTVTALRHPPELIQQRITTSQIRRTASSSCPEHTELCQHERRSSVSLSELEGSFVRLAIMLPPSKSKISNQCLQIFALPTSLALVRFMYSLWA